MDIQVTSKAFENEERIPRKYTCDGNDVSPPITWSGIPDGTASLVLIADDPDAPTKTWVHWVVYDLPPDTQGLDEAQPRDKRLPNGGIQGVTDFKQIGYGGPCPPSGTHRYYFKLYALNKKLNLEPGKTKTEVEEAMEGLIMAQGQLMGTYSRDK